MEPQTAGFKPPYMSFQTFWNFLDELTTKPLPPKIYRRSLMASKSGTDQTHLTAALTSFRLTEADGTVTQRLHEFAAADGEDRKAILNDWLHEFYADEIKVSESNATIEDLAESFQNSFGLSASETRRKCMTFFQHAMMKAGLHVSANFPKTRSGSGAPGRPKPKRLVRRKPATEQVQFGLPPEDDTEEEQERDGGGVYKHSVTLQTGATMTLIVSVNPFTLRGPDREFFFKTVDALVDYEETHQDSQR